MNFDAIIVGARVAGSAAAIFLARQGRKVLLVDKATFPSDAISTHIVMAGGVKILESLGALDELQRRGAMLLYKTRFLAPEGSTMGNLRDQQGKPSPALCLSRTVMDHAMVEMARATGGIEVRENFRMTDLLVENNAIAGIRGEDQSGVHEFRAPLSIGADGMHSSFAKIANERIGAFPRRDVPCARGYYYGYYTGVREDRLDDSIVIAFGKPGGSDHLACRCESGRTVLALAFDVTQIAEFKSDLLGNFQRRMVDDADFAAISEDATLASKVYSVGNLLNTYRDPVCDGGLLLGDAGLHVDPLFGQGHTFALVSAAALAQVASRWFEGGSGKFIPAKTMADFTARRDAELMAHYERTVTTSRTLESDPLFTMVRRATAKEQWASDEMSSFANFLIPPNEFPSMRLASLIARAMAQGN